MLLVLVLGLSATFMACDDVAGGNNDNGDNDDPPEAVLLDGVYSQDGASYKLSVSGGGSSLEWERYDGNGCMYENRGLFYDDPDWIKYMAQQTWCGGPDDTYWVANQTDADTIRIRNSEYGYYTAYDYGSTVYLRR